MNREIKFRFWIEKAKKMSDWETAKKECDRLSLLSFDGFIPMQFTGLKDKNGVEIYEGDCLGGYPHGEVLVRWQNEAGCWEAYWPEDGFDDEGETIEIERSSLLSNELSNCFDEWTVIGNIYENPELSNL